jgi:hypothetical protein
MSDENHSSGGVVHDLPQDLEEALRRSEGAGDMGRYYAAGPQRIDLLGRIREEGGDEAQAHRLGP